MGDGKGRKPDRSLRTYSLKSRRSRVRRRDMAKTVAAGASFREWFSSLPDMPLGNLYPCSKRWADPCFWIRNWDARTAIHHLCTPTSWLTT